MNSEELANIESSIERVREKRRAYHLAIINRHQIREQLEQAEIAVATARAEQDKSYDILMGLIIDGETLRGLRIDDAISVV